MKYIAGLSDARYNSSSGGLLCYALALLCCTGTEGGGPRWLATGTNQDSTEYVDNKIVVGDRGFVVREFSSKVQGVHVAKPSLSIMCDQIELCPPLGNTYFETGDCVDFKYEFLVPQRQEDVAVALSNTGSNTWHSLLGTKSWERVRAQALGAITVTGVSEAELEVESHYPVRVRVKGGASEARFNVEGSALGFTPRSG